jgi:hypothetical protein
LIVRDNAVLESRLSTVIEDAAAWSVEATQQEGGREKHCFH